MLSGARSHVRGLYQGGDHGRGGECRARSLHAGLHLHRAGAAHPESDAQHGHVRQERDGAPLLSRQHRHRQGQEVSDDTDHIQRGHLGLCGDQCQEASGQSSARLGVCPGVLEAAPVGDNLPGEAVCAAFSPVPRPPSEG